MKLVYFAVFYPQELGNGYTVEFPDLPGCVTQGSSMEETLEMAEDAAAGWILSTIEDGEEVPSPSKCIDISLYEGASFTNAILLDMEEYAKKYGETAIKKTLSIPRWINTLAEKKGVNFSRVLQHALKKELGLELADEVEMVQEALKTLRGDFVKTLVSQKQYPSRIDKNVTSSTKNTNRPIPVGGSIQ